MADETLTLLGSEGALSVLREEIENWVGSDYIFEKY